MDFLARREHSRQELYRKLTQRDFPPEEVEAVLTALQADNLLNEQRFTQAYINMRQQRGYGPMHIGQALRERGVPDSLIQQTLLMNSPDWHAIAAQVLAKKFPHANNADFEQTMKQKRFLQYRGFTMEQICTATKSDDGF